MSENPTNNVPDVLADSPAAPASDAPAGASPSQQNRGGRPKGSTDKRPRKRKAKASGAAAPTGGAPAAQQKPRGVDVFDGPTPGEGAPAAAPEAAKVSLSPEQLASMAIGSVNGLIAMAAPLRYPDPIAAILPLQPKEIEQLEPLLKEWMMSKDVKIDPGVAFLFLATLFLGGHIVAAEKALKLYRAPAAAAADPNAAAAPRGVVDTDAARAAQ